MNILLVNVTYYSDLKTSWQAIGKQNPTQINDDDDNTRLVAFFKATRVNLFATRPFASKGYKARSTIAAEASWHALEMYITNRYG